MNRYKKLIVNNPFIVSVMVNSLFFILFTPAFDANDDVAMMNIASGKYTGEPSEFLMFTRGRACGCLSK